MSQESRSLELPPSLRAAVLRLAAEDGVSPEQWVAIAVAQKIGAVEAAAEFFRRRAGNAQPADLRTILAFAPDRPPDEGDELPPGQ